VPVSLAKDRLAPVSCLSERLTDNADTGWHLILVGNSPRHGADLLAGAI
jgi:hypothetical protein